VLLAVTLAPNAAFAQSLGNQPARLAPAQAPLSSQAPGPGSPGATLVPGSGVMPTAQSPIEQP
jgi:hypothetical protein